MGCTNFFKFHPDATLSDYAERFGYDDAVLKRVVENSGYFELNAPVEDQETTLRKALLALDDKGLTDALYQKENRTTIPYITTQSTAHFGIGSAFIPMDAADMHIQASPRNNQYADSPLYEPTKQEKLKMYKTLYDAEEDEDAEETGDEEPLLISILDDDKKRVKRRRSSVPKYRNMVLKKPAIEQENRKYISIVDREQAPLISERNKLV